MKEVETDIEIQASPELVWQILTDFTNWSEWNPFLYRAAGQVGLDEQVTIYFQGPGKKETSMRCTIFRLEPEREWIWKGHVLAPFLFRIEHSFTIEPMEADRVRFIQRETFNGLLAPFVVKEAETTKGYQKMDQALKARAEQTK
jgi:hypothetical protein